MDWLLDYAKQQGPLVVLLGLNVWALMTGRVVTRGHLEDVIKEKDEQIRKGEMRETERQRVADGLTEVLTEVAPVVRKALRAERESAPS